MYFDHPWNKYFGVIVKMEAKTSSIALSSALWPSLIWDISFVKAENESATFKPHEKPLSYVSYKTLVSVQFCETNAETETIQLISDTYSCYQF